MKLEHLDFPHGLFLAPMAGVTDLTFRALCRRYGAEGVFTEMVSSRALCFADKNTEKLAKISDDEHPVFLQLFGNDPDTMARAALAALFFSPDVIDVNMGCPAPKVANNGDGSALMKDPDRAAAIVEAVNAAMKPYHIPVTVKMRIGFDDEHRNAVPFAVRMEKSGAAMLTVHGRTRAQMYAPPVDRSAIRAVKAAVSVPVVANGDVKDAASALEMLAETHCDGLMIGRGALGNPYIFSEIIAALEGKPYEKPSNETLYHDILWHMTALCELKGERVGACEARKHVAWYLKGMRGAAAYRDEINRASTLAAVKKVVAKALEIS